MNRWRWASIALLVIGTVIWRVGAIDSLAGMIEQAHAKHILKAENEAAFRQWLTEKPGRRAEFDALSALLKSEGVDDIVPVWTLTRGDISRLTWCRDAGFGLPPRRYWHKMAPALRIVRDHVIPAVGPVEVRSVFRTPELNKCARGASQSRHLTFAAIDLVAIKQPNNAKVFRQLCAAWKRAGPSSRWGFGAYFDPTKPEKNRDARFHVDATGWRSWGFSKSGASSYCLKSLT